LGVPKRHHIRRVERHRSWLVAVKRSPRRICRCFYDRRYGSKAAALAEAVAYRDLVLATMPGWGIHQRLSSRNKSGIIGVCFTQQHHGRRVAQFWTAYWKEDGRHQRRAFSVKRHGHRRAKALAVALRREKEAAARPEPPPIARGPLSNTGVLGVCRRIIRGVPVYVAVWRENGKQRMRGFSATRHGDAKALTLAIETRRQKHRPRRPERRGTARDRGGEDAGSRRPR
jgi:hypothetical protein